MALAITRDELDAAGLRQAASRSRDAARRMLALALVLEGTDRATAARSCGMDRQTLRDWVHRYNAEGLAGLSDRPREGRPSRLKAEQLGFAHRELGRWRSAVHTILSRPGRPPRCWSRSPGTGALA